MSDDPKKKGRQDRLTRRSREPHARGLCSSGGRRISQWQGVKPLGIGQEIEVGSWGPIHGSILFTGTASPSPRGRRSTAAAAPQQFWPDQLWSSAPSTAQSFHFLSNH
jgi:hypothetical protein